jgi:hypothetical protein
VRHVLVITQLMDQARTVAKTVAGEHLPSQPSAKVDAEPDPAPEPRRLTTRARRLTALARRARA